MITAPPMLLQASGSAAHLLYCQAYKEFFLRLSVFDPYVVAHSFGGFVFTQCASRDSTLAARLLLATVSS